MVKTVTKRLLGIEWIVFLRHVRGINEGGRAGEPETA
jgi:hypothetical protein